LTAEIKNLEQLLDQLDTISEDAERVSLGIIMEAVGSRSFGPLLVMAGVILISPLSGIPGMPTTMGIFVFLIAVQLLFHRQHFWLPHWLFRRSMTVKSLGKAVNWLRPSARFIDRWLQPRLPVFISGVSQYLIAVICLLLAAAMPVMELVLFSASSAGAVFVLFGLALIAHDGLLGLLAFILIVVTFRLVIYSFL